MPCRVCGARNGAAFSTIDANYSRCATCHTLQKQMSEADYLAMEPGYDPGDYLADQPEDVIRAYLKVSMRKIFLQEMLGSAGGHQGKAFLDVGCGMGGYMLAARDLGMSTLGFEPSANHGKVAIEKLGLEVVPDYFTPAKVVGRSFDVVLLSHVIEHIHNPGAFIADLLSVLNPGGMLVMVTPNADSLSARVTGKHWPMLVPLDHVTMLTAKSVSHLVPIDCHVQVGTSEYPSEFLATLASIAKRQIKGRATNYADTAAPEAPKVMMEVSLKSRLLRFALAAGSLPFHLLARATGQAAALRIAVRKPG